MEASYAVEMFDKYKEIYLTIMNSGSGDNKINIKDLIKEKYGDNARDFIAAVNKEGVDSFKDFIAKIVQPIERLNPRELNPDYDNILSGLVCWIVLELQLNKDK